MKRTAWIVCALVLAACSNDDQMSGDTARGSTGRATPDSTPARDNPPVAASCVTHRISGGGIGPLRVGMRVDSVPLVCPVSRDTVVQASEGQMSRVLSVLIGSDTVFAEVNDGRVWRVLVRSQGLFTADSLSVGSSIATLVELPDLNPMVGEGYLYVATPAHCGMSFRLSVPPSTLKSGEWTNAELRKLDPTVHVTRILLLGCRRPSP